MKNKKALPCPDCKGRGHITGGDEHSSWSRTCERCDGTGIVMVPKTQADKIRAMTDEELSAAIFRLIYCEDPAKFFCFGKDECRTIMDADGLIPDEWCRSCLLKALREPMEDMPPCPNIFEDKQESGLIEED